MKWYVLSICWLLSLLCLPTVTGSTTNKDEITEYKKIVVVVCCYNNIEWVQKNLDSIFSQEYPHYRLIFVDDASNDGTGDFVAEYVAQNNLEEQVTLLRNPARRRKLANLYRALYLCDDDEVVILIDGDDWLINGTVFSYINTLYQDPNIWFTYGQYKNEPVSEAHKWGFRELGYAAPVAPGVIENHTQRKNKFVFMHLRTFYAWLFKLIKLKDLIATGVPGYEGDFYPASNDMAMYFPIAEMVHHRLYFVPHILYIRNLYSQIVGFKVDKLIQRASAREIKLKQPYPIVKTPVFRDLERYKTAKADILIVSPGSSAHLTTLLESIREKIPGIGKISVLYNKSKTFLGTIKTIRTAFEDVHCIGYDTTTLRDLVLEQLHASEAEHIFIAHDKIAVHDTVDVGHMIYWLEKTWAHAFYLDRDIALYAHKAPRWLVQVDEGVCAWKFRFGRGVWRNLHPFALTLYRKASLYETIKQLEFETLADLEQGLNTYPLSLENIGLFYHTAKTDHLRFW